MAGVPQHHVSSPLKPGQQLGGGPVGRGRDVCRFTEVVEVRLLGLLGPLAPLVAWLLQRQATADLRRLKHLLETPPASSGPAPRRRRPEVGPW
jgi:hypothetical protein